MPVNLSIKDVPDALADGLRTRAQTNHRSLQRELMAIIEAAVNGTLVVRAPALLVNEPARPAYAVVPSPQHNPAGDCDGLLDELDAIVAGSRWGAAPILTRDQANDRRLQRELDFDSRRAQAAAGAS